MTKHDKYIAALTTAAKKATDKTKLKEKIRKIKQDKARMDWLAQ